MMVKKYDKLKKVILEHIHIVIGLFLFLFFYNIMENEANYNLILNIGYHKMLAVSVAIFSLLAYINDYSNAKVKEFQDSSEYYFGVNVSEDSFYNRLEFKVCLHAKLEMFLTTLVIIPVLFILSKFIYADYIFYYFFNLIRMFQKILLSFWCSIFSLIIIYLVIILNGIFTESRKNFFDGYRINTDKLITDARKSEVENRITEEYNEKLNAIIDDSRCRESGYFSFQITLLTKEVLSRADSLSKNEEDFFVYILYTYLKSEKILEDLVNSKDNGLIMFRDYFLGKWDFTAVIRIMRYTATFFYIAIIDISTINDLTESSKKNQSYDSVFLIGDRIETYDKCFEVENVVISKIVLMLGSKVLSAKYSNYDYLIDDFYIFSKTLYETYKEGLLSNNDFQIFTNYMHECLCRFALVKEPSLSYILDNLDRLYKKTEEYQILVDSLTEMKEAISNEDNDILY